ncbi:hypothetical protein OH786_14985 [Streptomyces atratus]|uniref:DUF5753 domain-containing protein n=1 Tax=Streptomyces atratus TaxID=1893 RepID=A0A1K2AXC8_STRAR|nr:hypothetical protein [Streptomyces atratus]SFX90827.1 hypothetical protein SAMN02787144_1007325 [Streptomyces atratus]
MGDKPRGTAFPLLGITEYVHGSVPRLDTVPPDQSHCPAMVDAEAGLEAYRLLLARMEAVALAPDESRDFIHSLIADR